MNSLTRAIHQVEQDFSRVEQKNYLHAEPLSSRLFKCTQRILPSTPHRSRLRPLFLVTSFAANTFTTCLATIETIASLAYTALMTLVHGLTFCKSQSLQRHVIKSWGYFYHSLCMVSSLGIALEQMKEAPNLSKTILRENFFHLYSAQLAQHTGNFFDFIACRNRKEDGIPLSKIRAIEIAIKEIPSVIAKAFSEEYRDLDVENFMDFLKNVNANDFNHYQRFFEHLSYTKLYMIEEIAQGYKRYEEQTMDSPVQLSSHSSVEYDNGTFVQSTTREKTIDSDTKPSLESLKNQEINEINKIFCPEENFFYELSNFNSDLKRHIKNAVKHLLLNPVYESLIYIEKVEGIDCNLLSAVEGFELVEPICRLSVLLEMIEKMNAPDVGASEDLKAIVAELRKIADVPYAKASLIRMLIGNQPYEIGNDPTYQGKAESLRMTIMGLFKAISQLGFPIQYKRDILGPSVCEAVEEVKHLGNLFEEYKNFDKNEKQLLMIQISLYSKNGILFHPNLEVSYHFENTYNISRQKAIRMQAFIAKLLNLKAQNLLKHFDEKIAANLA